MFTYSWDPDQPVPHHNRSASMGGGWRPGQESSFSEGSTYSSSTLQTQLGPHPADPHSAVLSADPAFSAPQQFSFGSPTSAYPSPPDGIPYGPKACSQAVRGQELWVYGGDAGRYVKLFGTGFPTFMTFVKHLHILEVRYSGSALE